LAAKRKHEALVKLLLSTDKVDVDLKDNWGRTLVLLAAKSGFEVVVRLLLDTSKVDADSKRKLL